MSEANTPTPRTARPHRLEPRHAVAVPLWATILLVFVIAAAVGGTTWWNALIVNTTYYQGFDDGWYRGQRATQTVKPRKPIQQRIQPTPAPKKSDQPPG